ncbi:MAG: kelch repeat-containing protein [Saprospiraceae bacterium]
MCCNICFKNKAKLIGWLVALVFFSGCTSWDLEKISFPEVITSPVVSSGPTPLEITVSGRISGLIQDATVIEHGHLWTLETGAFTLDDEVQRNQLGRIGNAEFETIISGLSPGKTVFFRAYAIYEEKTVFGEIQSFNPGDLTFEINIDDIAIEREDALIDLRVSTSISGLPEGVAIKELGVVWADHPDPQLKSDNFILEGLNVVFDGDQLSFENNLSNVPPGRYYFRSYAIFGETVYYGNVKCVSLGDFWVQKDYFPGRSRPEGISFTINDLGYFGLGGCPPPIEFSCGNIFGDWEFTDTWQYNPQTDDWIQVADAPEFQVRSQTFEVNGKAYYGFGNGSPYGPPFSDILWEYDPAANQWTDKAPFPPGPRGEVAAFAIGNSIFVGIGRDDQDILYRDFWQFNTITNEWTREKDFPGEIQSSCCGRPFSGFSIGDQGYMFLYNDLWKYTPSSDTWEKMTVSQGDLHGLLFIINDRAYFWASGDGMLEYDPAKESWTRRGPPHMGASFSVDGKGYVVEGSLFETQFWVYYPIQECN